MVKALVAASNETNGEELIVLPREEFDVLNKLVPQQKVLDPELRAKIEKILEEEIVGPFDTLENAMLYLNNITPEAIH